MCAWTAMHTATEDHNQREKTTVGSVETAGCVGQTPDTGGHSCHTCTITSGVPAAFALWRRYRSVTPGWLASANSPSVM